MASYSILRRRDNPIRPAAPLSPPPDADDRSLDEPDILKLRPAAVSSEPPAGMPPVVMQLPEVSGKARTGQSRLASLLYWAAIVVGGLLAIGLIWGPKKSPQRAMDEAPTWSPSEQTPAAPAAVQEPLRSVEWSLPSGGGETNAGTPAETVAPAVVPATAPPVEYAPASDAAATGHPTDPARADAPIATARVTGVRYTDESAPARPGEAAPLGISTPVAR